MPALHRAEQEEAELLAREYGFPPTVNGFTQLAVLLERRLGIIRRAATVARSVAAYDAPAQKSNPAEPARGQESPPPDTMELDPFAAKNAAQRTFRDAVDVVGDTLRCHDGPQQIAYRHPELVSAVMRSISTHLEIQAAHYLGRHNQESLRAVGRAQQQAAEATSRMSDTIAAAKAP